MPGSRAAGKSSQNRQTEKPGSEEAAPDFPKHGLNPYIFALLAWGLSKHPRCCRGTLEVRFKNHHYLRRNTVKKSLANFCMLARRAGREVTNTQHLRAAAVVAVVAFTTTPSYALNPSLAPGQNFNLSGFTLQLPFADSGSSSPKQVSGSALTTYQDSGHKYFFTESGDGAMVMKEYGAPPNCVTTPNSTHCRTELRENTSWSPTAATNRLQATVNVTEIDNGSVVIGQIHIDDSISTKPAMEMYYESNGDIKVGVEQNVDGSGGQGTPTLVGHVPVGTQFAYEIEWYSGGLKVAIGTDLDHLSGHFTTLSTKNLGTPKSYFKAGCYNQGTGTADVHFLTLSIQQ